MMGSAHDDNLYYSQETERRLRAEIERLRGEAFERLLDSAGYNAKLRAMLERIDYYYTLNDCDEMDEHEAVEIDVKALREIHKALAKEGK